MTSARLRHPLRTLLGLLGLALVVEYLVLPQIAGARASIDLLARVEPPMVVLGVVLWASSLLAYAQLLRGLLPEGERPPRRYLLRVQLATKALSNVLPAGAAAGTGLGFDLLRRGGVSGPAAGFALGTQALGSAVVLNALLWIGLVVSIPRRGFDPLYGTAAVAGALLLGGLALLVLLLTRGEERARRLARWLGHRLPLLDADTVEHALGEIAERLRDLARDRGVLLRAVGWAAANWLLDAAALWVFLRAFGADLQPEAILVAYGISNVLGALPITPGGLGIIEGVLTPLLVGFGARRGPAILGVISWRLVNFWLPIPLGAAVYLSLRAGQRRSRKVDELRRVLAEGSETAAASLPRARRLQRDGDR